MSVPWAASDACLRCASARDALRTQFPTLGITREAAHAFAATAPRDIVDRHFQLPLIVAELLPFRALRVAQLHTLGMDTCMAGLVSGVLLPPAPCADAGAERLLLDAARFLLHSGFIPASRLPDEAMNVAHIQQEWLTFDSDYHRLCADCDELADIAFFLDAQLRAAKEQGQLLRDAFSFSGRTLASLMHLAAAHRREALVAAAAAAGGHSGSAVLQQHGRTVRGLWREPLIWDDECNRLLALRCPDSDMQRLCSARWPADVQLPGTAAASKEASMPLHGEWHMQRLYTKADIRAEGEAQYNCLRYRRMSTLYAIPASCYWSLQFTPDAASAERLAAEAQLHRSAAQLRLTVHICSSGVLEVRAPSNSQPPLAALQALAAWGRRAGVRVPQYRSEISDVVETSDVISA
jgi:hypothetical protein